MVDERPRSASAQALDVTECEVLTAENFNEAVLQRPEILIPYLASFFERLRTANDRLRMEMRLRAQASRERLRLRLLWHESLPLWLRQLHLHQSR